MRVLWLSHLVPYPPKGGVQQRSFNLLRELSRHHDVDFLGFNQSALVPAEKLPDSVAALNEFCRVLDVFPIAHDDAAAKRQLALTALFSSAPYTVRWLESEPFRRRLAEVIATHQYDIVHFDTISLAIYRSLVADKTRTTLTHHNVESEMLIRRARAERNPAKAAYYYQEGKRLRGFEARVARQFDIHLTCSSLDSDRLEEISPGIRTEVVPNGVDTRYFDPAACPATIRPASLVFAGGLSWYPNASAMRFFVDKVWPALTRARPDASMTVIGRAPPEWLTRAAARDARLRVTGFVDDVRPYLRASQVYVCPIYDGGGTKLKVLDALAMGIPLVAHPVACEGIDVQPEKHVMLADTPEEFVRQTCRLFDDSDLRRRVADAGRTLAVSTYDFRGIGQRMADLYSELK